MAIITLVKNYRFTCKRKPQLTTPTNSMWSAERRMVEITYLLDLTVVPVTSFLFTCCVRSNSFVTVAAYAYMLFIYCISRPIRRTFFFSKKCDLNLTCILCAEGKYYFQTYKNPYSYYTTSLSWDSEICSQIMRSGITACERLSFL
jgi:hypothetical protein